ncbi:MAG: hypothetical protein GF350_06140, partial [Chitinivibrionales bacterium]|nr:hypothetical protein [Chitinivibrionales bacterium]
MKSCVLYVLLIGLSGFYSGAYSRNNSNASLPGDQYCVGATYSCAARRGYFDIKEYRREIEKEPLHFLGLLFGRRYYFYPWFRLQFGVMGDFSSEVLDTLIMYFPSENSIADVEVRNNIIHFSFDSEMHYVFPREKALIPFLCIGFGLNYLSIS